MSDAIREQRPFDQPLVSICMPTYNAEKTVKQTLESILNQTYRNIEILVVDNASTDNTVSVVRESADPRIKIYCNDTNIGAEGNFSKCVRLAKGEYTAIFHADDLYLPDMVQKQVQAFQENPTIGAVFTMAKRINSRDEVIGEMNLPSELRWKGKGVYHFPEIFLSVLKNGNFLVCPSAMVRSELYKQLVPFDAERFGTSADLDMWLRILERHTVTILEDKLMHYRISKSQGSYKFGYLRTQPADFFKVMDYYLSAKSNMLHISRSALNRYEFSRSMDRVRCAENHVIMGQLQDAKRLLRKSFSRNVFRGVMGSIRKPKVLAHWIIGMILLGLLYLGVGRYLRRVFRWFLYERKRGIIEP